MADYSTILSPTEKHRKSSSFPRLFTGLTFKNLSETAEAVMSPTSILDSKSFSGLMKNPFLPDLPTPKTPESETKRTWDKLDSRGLGLVDALNDDKFDNNLPKSESRMIIFGSQLKIQVPHLPLPFHSSPAESPKSPADFGIKTRNSQLGSFSSGLSHSPAKKSACGSTNWGMDTPNSPRFFTGCLSTSEMELSEEYTCVISYGPNPRTTHIFDDCIVESCCGIVGSDLRPESTGLSADGSIHSPENFLSFCYACKKHLVQGKNIYMYRGEKAFCSRECRYHVMLLEEGIDKLDVCGTCS